MVDSTDAFTTTRRGALKSGAVGLGGITGAIALTGSQAGSAAAALPSMATVAALAGVGGADYFLQLDPILGDSQDDRHRDWIDVLAFSWGASNTASGGAGGGGTVGRATISDLNFSARTGSASPRIFLRTMNGKHVPTALLQGVAAGDSRQRFLEVELKDVIVTSYSTSAADEGPMDSFTLAFTRIRYTIWPQDPKGGLGLPIEATWNLARSAET